MKKKGVLYMLVVVFFLLALCSITVLADTIKIGAFFPLSGAIADTGNRCKWAAETAMEIINNSYPDLDLPLAASEGLPNLDGKKIEIIFSDHQGKADVGKAEAERLITQQNVVGLLGGYNSGVTKSASIIAEKYGIPLVNGSSSSTDLHKQGFKTFFRVYSYDDLEMKSIFDGINEMNEKLGAGIKTYAVAYMVGEYGQNMLKWSQHYGDLYGYEMVEESGHPFGATDVSSAILRLKNANPDVIIHASLLSDYMLFLRGYKEANFFPKGIFSPCSGYQDLKLVERMGKDADYIFGTQIFKLDRVENNKNLKIVDGIYKKISNGKGLDGVVMGELEATLVLADAINRAGSVESNKIIEALKETDIQWDIDVGGGVKFTEEGQNERASVIISQIVGGEYKTVLPLDEATTDLIWPTPAWNQR
ncbi:hypothetical protein ES705_25475 [subsurface metagenome]|nr:MAG: amino acid ABC transporter substrate-binding protein [Candidatus Atribacteria bacterium 1244-E10-H5-B2]